MLLSLFIPTVLAAAPTQLGEVQSFGDYIAKIWEWGFGVILAISVLMLVVGGIAYMSAAGDENRIDQARQMVSGSMIATAIVLLSGVIRKWLFKPAEDLNVQVVQASDTVRLITNITNMLLGAVAGVALVALIWSGYQYLSARGQPEKIVQAKRAGTYALIGLSISILAYFIVDLVAGIWK